MQNPTLKAFGIHLRNLRLEQGLSQEELASLAGLHRTYIGGVERGERNPTLVTLVKIAKALGLSIPSLIDFSNPISDV